MSKKNLPEPPKQLSPRKLLEYFSNTGVKVCHRVYSCEVSRGLCFDMFGSFCTHDDGPYIDGGLPNGGLYDSPCHISIHQDYDVIIEEKVLSIFWKVKDGTAYYVIVPLDADTPSLDLQNIEIEDPEYDDFLVKIDD